MMDEPTFEDLVDRHGSDLARWPSTLRDAAAALVARSPAARALLAEMSAIEAVLRMAPSIETPGVAVMAAPIAARAIRNRQIARPNHGLRRTAWGAAWGTAAAAALVFGLFVGSTPPLTHDDSPDRIVAGALDSTGASDVTGAFDVD